MTTITKQQYHEHALIPIIEQCLDDAINGVSEIPNYSLEIPGMSGVVYRKFINNYARAISNPRYLEIGSYTGSTLCSAIGGIDGMEALAVDDFSYGGSSHEVCQQNVEAVRSSDAKISVINQKFEDFDFSAHGKFNIYMYDAEHTEMDQRLAISRCVPALDDVSLIIVDDWNDHGGVTTHVKLGTYAGFEDTNLEILYKFEVETGVNPPFPSPWHNGYGVFLVRNPNNGN